MIETIGRRLSAIKLVDEGDVVFARQRARQISALLAYDTQDQTRIATAVSEIARNAFIHGKRGLVEFSVDVDAQLLWICVSDSGPGIADVEALLDGRSPGAHQAMGISSARRLVDILRIESVAGTTVWLGKRLPAPLSDEHIVETAAALAGHTREDPLGEMREQNHELVGMLEELRARQQELERLNLELQDTNRGVVALYAELDEKAEQLRKANETKSRFLSYMSHEFRTPLNSTLALAQMLLERIDGPLTAEQERQVRYIQQSAEQLFHLVSDLLDIGKIEAGKITVHPTRFSVRTLFSTVRGMMRPLMTRPEVALIFDEPDDDITLTTDEGKLSQILRNLVSNAIKFTPAGEIRVAVSFHDDRVVFRVADSGIGVAPGDRERIFEEFAQVPNELQHEAKGSGLGLPLSRRLAQLLGGWISVDERPGGGSVFSVSLPAIHGEPGDAGPDDPISAGRPLRILMIDDNEVDRYLLRILLSGEGCTITEAGGGNEGIREALERRPDVIFLDLLMPDASGFEVLDRLAESESTRAIPVVIYTSKTLDRLERESLERRTVAIIRKDTARDDMVPRVRQALKAAATRTAEGASHAG